MSDEKSDKKTIAEWRRVRGEMSQFELAVAARVHPSTIAVAETGVNAPNTRTLKRIADALGVGMDQIILPAYRGKPRKPSGPRDGVGRHKRPTRSHRHTPGEGPGDGDNGDNGGEGDTGGDPKARARLAA